MSEEIRGLSPQEADEFISMAAQAFREGPQDAARWRKNARLEDMRALFAAGQMMTGLIAHSFETWFGQSTIPTGGLAGVASPPENRRQGYIGRLLHGVLSEMRENKVPLSTLYPFYFPFYKRFGWAHVSDNILYKIPMNHLPAGSTPGAWHKVYSHSSLPTPDPNGGIAAADLTVLREIYDSWCVGRSGPITRDERWWRIRKLGVGRDNRSDVYYWRDAASQPRAYVIYRFETLESMWDRRIHAEVVALDIVALRAVLQFLRNHDSQAKEVYIRQPEDTRLLALIDDPEFKVEVEAGLMLRLVDVAAAIAARRYPPHLAEQFTVAVADSFLDWNNTTFAVFVGEGAARVERTDTAAGLRMDQKTLAQIYSGYLTAAEALDLGLIEVENQASLAALARVFAGPRSYISDFF